MKNTNISKLTLVPCIPIGDTFPCEFYKTYHEYQRELRLIDGDINYPIESETECIAHLSKCDGYIDYAIYYGDKKIGIVSYQNVNWLDDGKAPILYIDQLYIMPEFRRNHFGSLVFKKILDSFKGYVIFFEVIACNDVAVKFWNNSVKENKCIFINDNRCTVKVKPEDHSEYISFVIKK